MKINQNVLFHFVMLPFFISFKYFFGILRKSLLPATVESYKKGESLNLIRLQFIDIDNTYFNYFLLIQIDFVI